MAVSARWRLLPVLTDLTCWLCAGRENLDYLGFCGPEGATHFPSSLFNKMLLFGFSF